MKKIRYMLHAMLILMLFLFSYLCDYISHITLYILLEITCITYFILLNKFQVKETYAQVIMNFYILLTQIIGTIIIMLMFIFLDFKIITETPFLIISSAASITGNLAIGKFNGIITKANENHSSSQHISQ